MATDPNDRFKYAIVRQPAPNFGDGLTTAVGMEPPDPDRMMAQHAAYVALLKELGLFIWPIDADPAFPDGHFVEDTAVVFPEAAVIARPGAPSRRGETEVVAPALAQFRDLHFIEPPGELDGGDVLRVERRFFIGLSHRTNEAGADQMAAILRKYDYAVTPAPVGDGLHLKSGVTHVGDGRLLTTPAFANNAVFYAFEKIIVEPDEAYAANTLLINDHLVMPAGFPKTRRQLEPLGREIRELEMSEARKMDGGLTCLSLRF